MGPASSAFDHDDFGDAEQHNFNHHNLDDDNNDNDASCEATADGRWFRHFVAAVLPVLAREARVRDRGNQ
jgi:hypothetical protein